MKYKVIIPAILFVEADSSIEAVERACRACLTPASTAITFHFSEATTEELATNTSEGDSQNK